MYTDLADHQGTTPHFSENSRFLVQRYKRRIEIKMLHTPFSVSPVEFGIINSLLFTKIYCVGRICKFDTASSLDRNINQHKSKKKTGQVGTFRKCSKQDTYKYKVIIWHKISFFSHGQIKNAITSLLIFCHKHYFSDSG